MSIEKNKSKFSFFTTIVKLGFREEKHISKEKKLIFIFNTSCVVWYVIGFVQILGYFFKSPVNFTNISVHLFLMLGIVMTQILHWKQYFNLGRVLFLLCLILMTILFSNYFRPGKLTEFFLFLVPGISLVFFNNKYINGFVLIFCFLCFAIPNVYLKIYPSISFYSPSMVCLFFCFNIMVTYFKQLNEKNERLLGLERDKVLSDKIILEKQEAKLRELNQFKTHFFVNLSHEIRTPITLIKGYAEKIDFDEAKQNNEQKLAVVKNQVTQIEDILNNILDLSKLDENKLTLHKTEVSIVSFVNKQYADFKDLFVKKNIAFTLIKGLDDNLQVTMDKDLMAKALNNLLNNALKFTKELGHVDVKIYQENDVFIEVIDNGIGVPAKDIDKIFERFYQSENEITKSQGSGIGLSFTKSIVNAQGFDITVESIPDVSTKFSIKIPEAYISTSSVLGKNSLPAIKTSMPTTSTINSLANTKSETILVVDDHEQLRHYLKMILNSYRILEAKNGIEALDILAHNPVDLVITDYMMPNMNGKQLVTKIKSTQNKVPIIMLTARVDDIAKLDMLRIGVDNYLIKPFIEEELLLSIKKALKAYKAIVDYQSQLTDEEKKELDSVEVQFSKKMNSIIENNITNPNFGVEDIALFFEVSKRTLTRRVKSILGSTTKDLIMQAKIEKARKLWLKNPKMPKSKIANAVGIKNTSYLFKKIAEQYGERFDG